MSLSCSLLGVGIRQGASLRVLTDCWGPRAEADAFGWAHASRLLSETCPQGGLACAEPLRGDRAGDGVEGARAAAGLSVLAGFSEPEPSVAGSWLLWVVLFLFFPLFLALREKPQFKGFLKT